MSAGWSEPVEGFVLAGGRSQRMGADKALVDLGGRPMGLAVCEVLGRRCARVRLVRRGLVDPGWTLGDGRRVDVVRDDGDAHPLWGVAAALRASATPWVAIAAVDLPSLRAAHLDALWAGRAGGAVLDSPSGWRLVMLLPTSALAEVEGLARASAPVRDLMARLARVAVDVELPDVNGPSDLINVRGAG